MGSLVTSMRVVRRADAVFALLDARGVLSARRCLRTFGRVRDTWGQGSNIACGLSAASEGEGFVVVLKLAI